MKRFALMMALLLLSLTACDSGTSVGKDLEVKNSPGSEGPRLGERLKVESPAPGESAPPEAAKSAPAKNPDPAPAQAPPFVIKINSDTSGAPAFEPRQAEVSAGTVVRWENTDTKPHSVKADNGTFRSPEIPGGGSWEYKATVVGDFNYTDGSRPYAVGTLIVS